ncbi:MAG: DUF2793 domain-containing protein, partial [Gammaproteobacteria bacterium]|nr:DUF2793 domain-containing protein [Gammaproteobacteria bacterium]
MTKIIGRQLKDYDLPYILKTTAPTPTDDGYSVPHLWVDRTNKKFYILIDNTSGSADWVELGKTTWDFQDSVLAFADCTAAPPTESTSDRYILDTTAGSVHANWDGAAKNDIVEFDGVEWDAYTPTEGTCCENEDDNTWYAFDGTSWAKFATFMVHNDLLGRSTAAAHPATAISTDTTNFDAILSASEDEAQKAFDALNSHKAAHIRTGGDEIDGDKLGVNWLPSVYTPDTSPPQVANSGELTSHLKGIDTLLG